MKSKSPTKSKSSTEPRIGDLKDCPTWQIKTCYMSMIEHGYRINYNTDWLCYRSLVEWHNETINVWTHLLGAMLFIFLIGYLQQMGKPTLQVVNFQSCTLDQRITLIDNSLDQGHWFHSFYDHHVERFTQVEESIRFGITQVKDRSFTDIVCMLEFMDSIPSHIDQQLEKLQTLYHLKDEASQFADQKIQQINQLTLLLRTNIDRNKAGNLYETLLTDKEFANVFPEVPSWPLHFQVIGSILCLAFSAYYHNFWCCSKERLHYLRKFDFIGISCAIAAQEMPILYYWLLSENHELARYLFTGSIVACSVWAVTVTLSPSHKKEFNNMRLQVTAYVAAALSCAPGILYVLISVEEAHNPLELLKVMSLSAMVYGIGALSFATRIPECYLIGKLDYIGNSHQIFHTAVVIGALISFYCTLRAYYECKLFMV